MKFFLLAITLLLSSCGDKMECLFNGCPKENPTPVEKVTQAQIEKLLTLDKLITAWAPTCEGGIACENDSDGDSMLWAGLLCSVGINSQCIAVKNSQSSDGQLWRAPSRVNVDKENSFSRDMLLGFLYYLVATKDINAANKFFIYVKNKFINVSNNIYSFNISCDFYFISCWLWKSICMPY